MRRLAIVVFLLVAPFCWGCRLWEPERCYPVYCCPPQQYTYGQPTRMQAVRASTPYYGPPATSQPCCP